MKKQWQPTRMGLTHPRGLELQSRRPASLLTMIVTFLTQNFHPSREKCQYHAIPTLAYLVMTLHEDEANHVRLRRTFARVALWTIINNCEANRRYIAPMPILEALSLRNGFEEMSYIESHLMSNHLRSTVVECFPSIVTQRVRHSLQRQNTATMPQNCTYDMGMPFKL